MLFTADRVYETSTTTGTGALTLGGAVATYRTWDDGYTVNDKVWYIIEDATDYEVGKGTLTSSTTLARDSGVIVSSNANALVSFGAGTKKVYSTRPSTAFDDIRATEVFAASLGSATYTQIQRLDDLTRSAGHMDGGDITDAGSGNIDVAAGSGLIRATSDDTSTLNSFDWSASAGISIPSNSIRYVYIDYNAGTPIVAITATDSFDYRTQFPLGFVANEGGTLYISQTPHSTGRAVGRILRRNYEVEGRSRADTLGGLIISESGTKKVAMTGGVTWFRGNRETIAAFDSNAAGTFTRYYRDGASGWTLETAQTDLPLNTYDDNSGTLATVGNNNHAVYWIYLGPGSTVALVYGRGDYNTFNQAEASTPPSTLPIRLQQGSLILGRFITNRSGGTSTVVATETAFITALSAGTVSAHNNLSGIQGGTLTEYYHLTSAEYTDLDNAAALKSATTIVDVSAATAPTTGQVLTATSGTAATWQTPSASSGGGFSGINVRLASNNNHTISSAPTTCDSVTLAVNDLVLLKNQTTGSENGVYKFNGAGSAYTRDTTMDTSGKCVSGMLISVSEGTINADTVWMLTTNSPITLGSTTLTFLTEGNAVATPSTYTATIGDGSSASINIAHSLSTTDPLVTLRDVSTGYFVYPDIKYVDVNNVLLEFVSAPTTNQYRVLVK